MAMKAHLNTIIKVRVKIDHSKIDKKLTTVQLLMRITFRKDPVISLTHPRTSITHLTITNNKVRRKRKSDQKIILKSSKWNLMVVTLIRYIAKWIQKITHKIVNSKRAESRSRIDLRCIKRWMKMRTTWLIVRIIIKIKFQIRIV
jgi:hypothetical protein